MVNFSSHSSLIDPHNFYSQTKFTLILDEAFSFSMLACSLLKLSDKWFTNQWNNGKQSSLSCSIHYFGDVTFEADVSKVILWLEYPGLTAITKT